MAHFHLCMCFLLGVSFPKELHRILEINKITSKGDCNSTRLLQFQKITFSSTALEAESGCKNICSTDDVFTVSSNKYSLIEVVDLKCPLTNENKRKEEEKSILSFSALSLSRLV